MITTDKDLAEKALLGAKILRAAAEKVAQSGNLLGGIVAEVNFATADAIEQIAKENEKLLAQLVAFQKAANPAVAVDLASGPDTTACYTPFVTGTRVCLKANPDQRGTVAGSSISSYTERRYYVCFDSEFEKNRWVKARNLELVPDK
ncbi:TPA: hypothetical protein P2B70_003289 [Salmonella enterica subsp. enterica serovar Eastbourne]|nr:hypothetical protein [Salmonella enterica subsp. enterica serovar Eastbourne]HDN7573170.1 hypothetical protein [Salmonella enterica subsp. enterica serovar Eastbourne]